MKQILSLVLIWMSVGVMCAQDMKAVFIQMPDSIVPLLTKVNREDCVDFLASNMAAKVKNRFDKQAELKVMTDDYLQMQLTEVSSMEMKLIPLNDSVKVICMVKTYCASACDSEIRFYTTDWKELSAMERFQYPSSDMFIQMTEAISDESKMLLNKLDVKMYKLSLIPDETALLVEYATPQYLNSEDREKLLPYLRKEPLKYIWKEGRFVQK